MNSAEAGVAPPRTRDASLRRELRRAERRRQVMAFLLVAPLLAFILIFFILPIGKMLLLSVQSGEMREVMPHAAEALRGWGGRGLPDETVMTAFATDLAAAQKARKVAIVAKRLNYEDPDFRPLLA